MRFLDPTVSCFPGHADVLTSNSSFIVSTTELPTLPETYTTPFLLCHQAQDTRHKARDRDRDRPGTHGGQMKRNKRPPIGKIIDKIVVSIAEGPLPQVGHCPRQRVRSTLFVPRAQHRHGHKNTDRHRHKCQGNSTRTWTPSLSCIHYNTHTLSLTHLHD